MNEFALPVLRHSIEDAARILGVSRATVYCRISAGELVAHRDGRRAFVTVDELRRYVQTKAARAAIGQAA